ncbi:hypothetical protein F4778DRAFT_592559 [Xylariomycetidae sp. FL2044]|nr:hypothetical protein F4778DRAFT_592559 [Xylariomycetidae sp. FL2044]
MDWSKSASLSHEPDLFFLLLSGEVGQGAMRRVTSITVTFGSRWMGHTQIIILSGLGLGASMRKDRDSERKREIEVRRIIIIPVLNSFTYMVRFFELVFIIRERDLST